MYYRSEKAGPDDDDGEGEKYPEEPRSRPFNHLIGWVAGAVWKWKMENETICGICQGPFEGCCPSCHLPGDACPIAIGACRHAFHRHCIAKWTDQQEGHGISHCPMCRSPWSE